MNRVLVTGASGFVGTHLLEALSERDIKTTALYFSNKPKQNTAPCDTSINWVRCDLSREDIDGHLTGVDVVFHLAGYTGLGSSSDTIERLNNVNVVATERLASAVLRAGCRIIYVSSVHACEETDEGNIIHEENGYPQSEYGRSKLRAENLLRALGSRGLNFTILRPTQLFGEYHEGSIYELVKAIKQRRFFLIGDGNNGTSFYYVRDFVDTLLRVAENPKCKNQTYIAADEPLQLKLLAEEISRHVGVPVNRLRLPRTLGMMAGAACDVLSRCLSVKLPLSKQRVRAITRNIQYSNKKLIADIGSEMPFGIKTGLSRTIRWYYSSGLL